MRNAVLETSYFLITLCMSLVELFSQDLFVARRNLPTGGVCSIAVAVDDLNGDQIQDLAIANCESRNVSILLGNGSGSFSAPSNFAAGDCAFHIAVKDIDGDGKKDLVVANFGEFNISLLMGDGTGRFGLPINIPVGHFNTGVAAEDLNGDGCMDIVSANFGPLDEPPYNRTITVLLSDCQGGYLRNDITVGEAPESVLAADFNSDGTLDLVSLNFYSHNISLLIGNGDGSFQAPRDYALPNNALPAYGFVADYNGDSNPDLVTANWGPANNVSVLLGNGQGGFSSRNEFAVGRAPRAVVAGDFNGDGALDLATSNWLPDNSVSVLFGDGSGRFGDRKDLPTGGQDTYFIGMGDFNRDNNLDLVAVNGISRDLTILLGDGQGNFGNFFRVVNSPTSVVKGDFNRDGIMDLAVANVDSSDVWMLLGDGKGGFRVASRTNVGSRPVSLVAGYFNQDANLDLAVANFGSRSVSILLGDGAGGFTVRPEFVLPSGASFPNSIVEGDFNNDGKLDVATANVATNNVSVLLGDGAGGFSSAINVPLPTGASSPWFINKGAFRGPAVDLVVANSGSNNISLLLGDGRGGFSPGANFVVGNAPRSVAVDDFNRDGKLDLAVANFGSNTVSVLFGNGLGGFSGRTDYAVGGGPDHVSLGDFDGDGRIDLAVANFNSDTVSILLADQQTPGRFRPAVNFFAGLGLTSIAVADVNGDGKPDLALTNSGSNNISVLINNRP